LLVVESVKEYLDGKLPSYTEKKEKKAALDLLSKEKLTPRLYSAIDLDLRVANFPHVQYIPRAVEEWIKSKIDESVESSRVSEKIIDGVAPKLSNALWDLYNNRMLYFLSLLDNGLYYENLRKAPKEIEKAAFTFLSNSFYEKITALPRKGISLLEGPVKKYSPSFVMRFFRFCIKSIFIVPGMTLLFNFFSGKLLCNRLARAIIAALKNSAIFDLFYVLLDRMSKKIYYTSSRLDTPPKQGKLSLIKKPIGQVGGYFIKSFLPDFILNRLKIQKWEQKFGEYVGKKALPYLKKPLDEMMKEAMPGIVKLMIISRITKKVSKATGKDAHELKNCIKIHIYLYCIDMTPLERNLYCRDLLKKSPSAILKEISLSSTS
jgi:hypothetical protein